MMHCFEVLLELIKAPECQDIIGDVGMPVVHLGVRYNCRVIFYNQKLLLIRPKKFLANDGNYREMRWFSPWVRDNVIEDHRLPAFVASAINQDTVSFGDGVLGVLG